MVLESTIICVDNSDFMRNGDFVPTRMQAQQDAVNIVCLSKTRANPENNVALLKMAAVEVLVTLTTDVGRILARLHQVSPKGTISFLNAVRVAHLALKHRQGRNHKLRIVVFVGSPIEEDEPQIVKVAKKLKKEKVNVDVINFGEEGLNTEKLTAFVNALNSGGGSGSHLVTVPPGPMLSDALLTSPVIVGEDGTGAGLNVGSFEFGVDPNEDPELALALRVSMEEQRARQEQEARQATTASAMEAKEQTASSEATAEEALLQRALTMSMGQEDAQPPAADTPLDAMTEEEQIAYALRLSLSQSVGAEASDAPAPMEVDDEGTSVDKPKEAKKEEEDYSEVMNDPAFLQSVLENLPGVDPNSEPIQRAMSSLKDAGKKEDKDKKEGK